jgi:hypothetical protein
MSACRERPSISLTGNALAGPLMARRPAVKARHLFAALGVALVCLALGLVLRDSPGSAGRSAVARALAHSYRQQGTLSLPAGARAPVSAALGEDSPAYRVTPAAGGYGAHSPAQRLALRFTRSGVSVTSHHGSFGLALREIGRGSRLRAVGASDPTAAANHVSYALGGGLREWYTSGPLGLEQGFDLEKAPAGRGGPLTLSLALSGNLRARLAKGGVSLTGHGARLRYAGLGVRDARGRKLRAWLELRHHNVLIRIADRGARYPLRIDPWVQSAELSASDQTANSYFGTSVAVSGNTVVVGEPTADNGAGAVYAFTRGAAGWANATQTAKLTASNPETNATSNAFSGEQLGQSVAIDGSTIVAGAPYWTQYSNSGNVEYQGAVYEWTLPETGVWANATQTAYLTATNLTQTDYLGLSVAVQGSTIVAGAPNHQFETPEGGPGSVYVYTMPASGGWVNATQTAELGGFYPDAGDSVGGSVAISGSTIVAGAPEEQYDGVGNNASRGGVYVWTDPASGGWADATTVELTQPSDLHNGDQLGQSVAVSGSTIAAGAPDHTPGNAIAARQGAVYVWTLPPVGGWANATQPAELSASDAGAGGQFLSDALGTSVAISGSTIFGGAPLHYVGSNNAEGAVYEWTQPASGFWADETQAAELIPSDGAAQDRFGGKMATSGSTLVLGALGADNYAGRAYVFGGGYTVSGTVSNGCGCGAIGGITILVTGTATDGSAVSVTGTSADGTGAWSVQVPPGSYTATPVENDGKTPIGPAIVPEDVSDIQVGPDRDDVNFVACAEPVGDAATSRSSSASAASDGSAASRLRSHAAMTGPVTFCKSVYTVTMSASLNERVFADPSLAAHYNTDSDPDKAGYNHKIPWYYSLSHNETVRRELGAATEFPECMSDSDVAMYTRAHDRVEWYSYLLGGSSLGSVTVQLTWDQHQQTVEDYGDPTWTPGLVTKVWKWHVTGSGGYSRTGTCRITDEVRPIALAVGGDDGTKAKLKPTQFAIVAAWGIPFDSPGVKIDPDGNSELVKDAQELGSKIYELYEAAKEKFESLPKPIKFLLEFGAKYYLGGKIIGALEAAPALIEKFMGEKLLASAAAKTFEGLAYVGEKYHLAHTLNEWAGFLGGYMGFSGEEPFELTPELKLPSGAYPIMSDVLLGQFRTTHYTYNKSLNEAIPDSEVLGLGVSKTEFPNLQLKVSRTALNASYQSQVYEGALPWKTAPHGTLVQTYNPFSQYDPYTINDTLDDARTFDSGRKSVLNILEATDQNPAVTESIREYGTPAGKWNEEQEEAPEPACDDDAFPESNTKAVFCWGFSDGRP